jgi:cyd operon protein YbgT
MWYFAWILGTAFACSFAILYALWFELKQEPLNKIKT